MKRKLVQQGSGTLMVSLPKLWVEERKLRKGDEVELTQAAQGVLVSTTSGRKRVEARELHITGVKLLKNRIVTALYQEGIDELVLYYDAPEVADAITKQAVAECIGFEVVEQTPKMMKIRDISGNSGEDFDTALRRIFHIIKILFDDVHELRKGKVSAEHIASVEATINRFSNYCLRVLNKQGYEKKEKLVIVFQLVHNLERVADEIKSIAQERVSAGEEKQIHEIKDFFVQSEKLYYTFSLEDAEKVARIFASLQKKITSAGVRALLIGALDVFSAVFRARI